PRVIGSKAVVAAGWFFQNPGVSAGENGDSNVFSAFGPSPTFVSPVVRVSLMPPTSTVVEAWIVFVPGTEEGITTSQVPLPEIWGGTGSPVLHVCVFGVAAPEMTVTVHTVPSGAFTNPLPVPSLTLMWQCSVCSAPTGFVAFSGVIWMFASTNVL